MNRDELKSRELNRRDFFRSAAAGAAGVTLAASGLWAAEGGCCPKASDRGAAGEKGAQGWTVLFDGKNVDRWDMTTPGAWKIQDDGSLHTLGKGKDIYTKEKFQDFTLDLQVNMSKGCNSGVFVRMADRKDWLHSSMEIQVLDSAGKAEVGKHDCGAVYDALAPSANAAKPAGQWNRMRITCFKNRVFVALNGIQIIDMDLNKWDTARKNADGSKNKFRDPLKTLTHAGFVALQGHGKPVTYKSIRIKPITALGKCPKCGKQGPEGWYCCTRCNAVFAAPAKVQCDACGDVAAGTYCAKCNSFHFGPDAETCPTCDLKRGQLSPRGGYALCCGAAYCAKCKKPYANTGAGCPSCKK